MSTQATAVVQKLPVKTKLSYGLGTLAFGTKDAGFNGLLMLFYNQVIGVPAAWVGAVIGLAMLIDALVDPLIGHVSDNWKSSWGRRHPFMYAAAIPSGLFYALLWMPPAVDPLWQCAWLAVTAIAVRLSVSLFEIPNYALATEFTEDYEERTSLQTYRGLFLAVGGAVVGLVTYKVFLVPTADGKVGQLNEAGYHQYGVAAALLIMFCILVSAWGTHDRAKNLISRGGGERLSLPEFFRNLRTVMSDKVYASLLWANITFCLTVGLDVTLGTYLGTYLWKLSAEQFGTIAALGSLAALVLGVTVVNLTKKRDKKTVAMILLAIAIAGLVLPLAAALLGLIPTTGPTVIPMLTARLIVVFASVLGLGIVVGSMVADVGDHFRLKTGHHIEGLMFSTLVLSQKAVSGIGIFLGGLVLSFVGFPEKATPEQVTPDLVNSLGWTVAGSEAVLLLLALYSLSRFSMTRASHAEIVKQIHSGRVPDAE